MEETLAKTTWKGSSFSTDRFFFFPCRPFNLQHQVRFSERLATARSFSPQEVGGWVYPEDDGNLGQSCPHIPAIGSVGLVYLPAKLIGKN